MDRLSVKMTEKQFDSCYWYATEIKNFAKKIGIPSYSKLRKDELESAIKNFLRTGRRRLATKRKLNQKGPKDSEKGLTLKQRVINYTNNKETKEWIVQQARRIDKGFKEKSGARLRLNRWREEQISNGRKITYGHLVKYYVKLNKGSEPFKNKFPSGRYINFLSEYLAKEKGAKHGDAIKAWHALKKFDIPKTYRDWKRHTKK